MIDRGLSGSTRRALDARTTTYIGTMCDTATGDRLDRARLSRSKAEMVEGSLSKSACTLKFGQKRRKGLGAMLLD